MTETTNYKDMDMEEKSVMKQEDRTLDAEESVNNVSQQSVTSSTSTDSFQTEVVPDPKQGGGVN